MRSHVGVPIVVDEKVEGTINLYSKTPGFYDETHARNLQIFANQVAIATRNAQLYQEVQRIASYDSLIGIFNRRRFMLDAEKEIQRAKRHSANICFIILDADHFKLVNDTYGHLAGDAVLIHLARMVESQTRPYDVVGRYGGEEIVLLLPETSLAEAAIVAERIRQTVADTPVIHGEQVITCTISVGVSGNELDEKIDLESMLKLADRALYQAKEAGRNRVVVSKASLQ